MNEFDLSLKIAPSRAKTALSAFMVAGTKSGCGKTTASLAIMAALTRRGLAVQAFKTGPDFIDPGHHALATGRPSHNLDGWMMGEAALRRCFERHAAGADAAVVEGAMGLFDGASGDSGQGSAAQAAGLLGLPVVLVLDAAGLGRSAAAMALGYARFDPSLKIAGVIANNVSSDNHEFVLHQAFAGLGDLPFLGALPRDAAVGLPSRHLGLVTAEDAGRSDDFFAALARLAESRLDLDGLLARCARPAPAAKSPTDPRSDPIPVPKRTRLAVSRDRAFCFVYRENLRLLEEAGARIVFFSPLDDRTLPEDIGGVYLCGGYPELHARALSENASLLGELRAFADAGGPVYAECGGFMALARALRDAGGEVFPMAGVFPFLAAMGEKRQALGYREIATRAASLLGPAGTTARGHEFHYSRIAAYGAPQTEAIYDLTGSRGALPGPEGFVRGNVLASYVHLHFASNPEIPGHFMRLCAAYRAGLAPRETARG
ncbi:MAG: cobyrinate a,c-diamide synthase [Desulfovibrionaceae bacterium]|nr:cobyrinate a,c-diamide synthase [Desulfovibrionaceae bacterium]MBF0513170.1 cobyrinate a,c-diamide synthase [Desulfovibrionaceae bacterium]